MVKPRLPPTLGEKMYHVPWYSTKSRHPEFAALMSATLPVLVVLLPNATLLQMVTAPMQSSGGGGGGTQVTDAP